MCSQAFKDYTESVLITENRHLKLMVLVLFSVWKDARVWVHRNYSLCIITI